MPSPSSGSDTSHSSRVLPVAFETIGNIRITSEMGSKHIFLKKDFLQGGWGVCEMLFPFHKNQLLYKHTHRYTRRTGVHSPSCGSSTLEGSLNAALKHT